MAFDFEEFIQKANKTIQHIKEDVSTLRTGRASVQLLDSVTVEAYGTKMRVHELANVSAPDPNLLLVSPWDKSLLSTIEKAIASSGINLHPVVDSDIIRIVVPALTEERRQDMVKLLNQKIQNGHIMLRNVRGDIRKDIERLVDEAGVSEDEIKGDLAELDKKFKEFAAQIDQMSSDKTKELMTF